MIANLKRNKTAYIRSLKIAIIYAVFSITWILFSDKALLLLTTNPETLTWLQTIKGWCFVLLSACIIFLLLYKEIQEQIETKEKYQAILDHHHQLTGLLTPQGILVSANTAALDFVDSNTDDVIGKFFWETPWWKHSKETRQKLKKGIIEASQGKFVQFETTHIDTLGETRTMDFSLNPVTNTSGEVIYIVPEGKDISHLKKVEKALLESQALYKEAQSIALIGHWKINHTNAQRQWSDELFNIFEVEKDHFKLNSKNFLTLIHPEDRDYVKEQFRQSIENKSQYIAEHRILLANGKIKYILEQGRTEFGADGTPLISIGTSQDITEKRMGEEKLRQAQKMEAIGTLAGGIAHDFNNILSGVIGYTEIVLDDEIPENSKSRKSLEQVLIAANRAKDLVKQILTFSRQASSKKMVIDVSPIIKEVLKLMRASLPANIKIKQIVTEERFLIHGDPIQIHQVITNLCSNAGYAMRDKGGSLSIELSISEENTGNGEQVEPGSSNKYCSLVVSDTGPGIEKSIVNKIFNPFFTTKPKEEGTGLGLSVVHGIVKEHFGDISVTSNPGTGTRFTIQFPLVSDISETEREGEIHIPKGSEYILFVDDEKPIVDIYSDALEKLGYMVDSTTNSLEALKMFATDPHKYDLLISDQTMPDMTGDQLVREILHIRPDLPIILCTGYSHILSFEQAEKLGVKKLLMKPFSKKELHLHVSNVLNK